MKVKHAVIKKHLFEIRFDPIPSFLDKRGQITETLTDNIFNSWIIKPARIDLTNKDNKNIGFFLTVNNYGIASEPPYKTDDFVGITQEMIKKLWTVVPPNKQKRFGIRTTTYIPSNKSFVDLVSLFKETFLNKNIDKFMKSGVSMVDLGMPLNFQDADGALFNISVGPMEKKQISELFSDKKLIANRGIYIDVDYFIDNISIFSQNRQKLFLDFVIKGTAKADEINQIVLKILKLDK